MSAQDDLTAAVYRAIEKAGAERMSGQINDQLHDVSVNLVGPTAKTKENAVRRYMPLFRKAIKGARIVVLRDGPRIATTEGKLLVVSNLVIEG